MLSVVSFFKNRKTKICTKSDVRSRCENTIIAVINYGDLPEKFILHVSPFKVTRVTGNGTD